jgi:hypothetical protein
LQLFIGHGALPDAHLSFKGVLACGGDQQMGSGNAQKFAPTAVYLLDFQLLPYHKSEPIGQHQKMQVRHGDFVVFVTDGSLWKNIGFARLSNCLLLQSFTIY